MSISSVTRSIDFFSYEYHNRTVTLTKCGDASGHEVERTQRRLLDHVIT